MNLFTFFALLILPLSVSATSILACHTRQGKFAHEDETSGKVVITPAAVVLFKFKPVSETFVFDIRRASTETSRTGTWTTYDLEKGDELITLQVEEADTSRRAYLTREHANNSQAPNISVVALKCFLWNFQSKKLRQ